MLHEKAGVLLDDVLEMGVLLLRYLHQRSAQVLVDLDVVHVFHHSLLAILLPPKLVLMWLELNFAADRASLEVEGHGLVFALFKAARVLHDDHVHPGEDVRLDREKPVDAGEQRLVVCLLEVGVHVVEQAFQNINFTGPQSLDDEPAVLRKEEEGTALACALSSLENHQPVRFKR